MSHANLQQVLWLTERSPRHQQRARDVAPPELAITMLRHPTPAELAPYLLTTEILISERRGIIDADLLAQMPTLRFILRLGATAYDIDLDATRTRNIPVARQPDLGNLLVAEHCLMMMLALSKRLHQAQIAAQNQAGNRPAQRTDENTFAYNWASMAGVDSLYGKTVGILGMGDIGIELVRRVRPFLPQAMLYHKRSRLPQEVEHDLAIQYVELDGCYQRADILVCLLPFTSATDSLVDAQAIAQMKKGALLIQAGSGSTIDEQALAEAIQAGQLGGVALDTFEYEPLTRDHLLLALAQNPAHNIILTPHIAGGTTAHTQNRGYEFAEIKRFRLGEPLQLRIDN